MRPVVVGLYLLYAAALGYLTLARQPLEPLPLGVDRVVAWFADVPAERPGDDPASGTPSDSLPTARSADGVPAGRIVVVAGNVALFVPLGLIVHREGARSLAAAVGAGAVVSGVVEALQLTVATWRHPQLVDLVLNALGAGVGWLATHAVVTVQERARSR